MVYSDRLTLVEDSGRLTLGLYPLRAEPVIKHLKSVIRSRYISMHECTWRVAVSTCVEVAEQNWSTASQ